MGSRGAFVNVDMGDFTFKENGQNYYSVGTLSNDENVKVLIQDKGSVKAPEYSHTAGRVYAIVQDGVLKHVTYYDENHKQNVSIDLWHTHKGVKPHVHFGLNHDHNNLPVKPTQKQLRLIAKIKKEYKLK